MEENKKEWERLAQIEKEIEREGLTPLELAHLEAEALLIRGKVLRRIFDTLENLD